MDDKPDSAPLRQLHEMRERSLQGGGPERIGQHESSAAIGERFSA